MENFKITPLFPKAVLTSDIGRGITEEELSVVDEHREKAMPNIGNVQSIDHQVLNDPRMSNIKDFIIQGIIRYHDEVIAPSNKIQFYITQSWLNWTSPGQYHHKHTHPNSILSGVFYMKTDPLYDKVVFYKDDYEQIQIMPKRYNMFNSRAWFSSVNDGKLIIFPSEMVHMVETKKGDNERVALAFNTFIRGEVGEELGASLLTIK